jgi:hypothetical protein
MLREAEMEGLGNASLDRIEVVGTPIDQVRRPFRRGNINLIGLDPKMDVYMGRTCDGCLHFTRTGIDVYLANPKLLENVDKVTFIIGKNAIPPEHLDNNPPHSYVFVVGDCAEEHKGRGIFLPGCASTSMHRTFFPGKTAEQVVETYQQVQPKLKPDA